MEAADCQPVGDRVPGPLMGGGEDGQTDVTAGGLLSVIFECAYTALAARRPVDEVPAPADAETPEDAGHPTGQG